MGTRERKQPLSVDVEGGLCRWLGSAHSSKDKAGTHQRKEGGLFQEKGMRPAKEGWEGQDPLGIAEAPGVAGVE